MYPTVNNYIVGLTFEKGSCVSDRLLHYLLIQLPLQANILIGDRSGHTKNPFRLSGSNTTCFPSNVIETQEGKAGVNKIISLNWKALRYFSINLKILCHVSLPVLFDNCGMETLFTPLYNLKLSMHQAEYLLERSLKVFAEIDTLTRIYLCRGYASPWNAAAFKHRTFQNLFLH